MIHIPTEEIKQPRLHADTLGFTFVWKDHFLRGIYPDSEKQVRLYFESGFLDEVVNKGIFPKTRISEFENEQFCMILEHEMISPILYATEWNFSMLKGAALMVLDIAQIAWRYGYNMVDCHKLNVLFKGTEPIYVDLGSFIPREEGCSGWLPYMTFLSSYYYILDLWNDGAEQLAKRMMAPGVVFNGIDYYIYKSILCRCFPALASLRLRFKENLSRLAYTSTEKIKNKIQKSPNRINKYLLKVSYCCVQTFKPSPSQHLQKLERKIKKKTLSRNCFREEEQYDVSEVLEAIGKIGKPQSITFIDSPTKAWVNVCKDAKEVISIQQNPKISNDEYQYIRTIGDTRLTTVSFYLSNGAIILRNKLPESRFSSDLVVVLGYRIPSGPFGLHNAMVFFDRCRLYSTSGKMIVGVKNCNEIQRFELLKTYFTEIVGNTFIYTK